MLSGDAAQHIVVVGSGVIGPGIALAYGRAGFEVTLADIDQGALDRAMAQLRNACRVMAEEDYLPADQGETAMARIRPATQFEDALATADFVLEAIPEKLDLKQSLFRHFDEVCREDIYLGTNSSSMRVTEIAAVTKRPERVIGQHWVQPAFLIPAVEVIHGDRTAPEAIEFCRRLLIRARKQPVVCKDIPGFIFNRFQHVLYTEALSIVEQGAATIEDVDNAFRYGLSMRYPIWSILGTHDRAATKVTSLHVERYLRESTGDPKFGPSPLMEEKVEKGEIGIWAGKGWYDYTGQSVEALVEDRDRKITRMMALLEKNGFM